MERYLKVCALGLLVGAVYVFATRLLGVHTMMGSGLGMFLGVRGEMGLILLDAVPQIFWSGIIYYLYQTLVGWQSFPGAETGERLLAALFFGLGVSVFYVIWILTIATAMQPEIG